NLNMQLNEMKLPSFCACRKLHALHKNQKRIFTAAAPVFFGAGRARSAFQWIQLQEPTLRKLHTLRKSQKKTFTAAAPVSFRVRRALSAFRVIGQNKTNYSAFHKIRVMIL
ncbi:hypothetical protein, partial [Listeria booriae]|uniref:hypothetical protein n=1 Tax=Listeria booriae TaxID=1552123 RepID=UPI001C89768B